MANMKRARTLPVWCGGGGDGDGKSTQQTTSIVGPSEACSNPPKLPRIWW